MHFREHPCLMVDIFYFFGLRITLTRIGMAKASADCIGEAHGGFSSDGSDISGFSHMVCLSSGFRSLEAYH